MKSFIVGMIRLTWLTFKSGLWLPLVPIYVVQHLVLPLPHIPAATALLMMLG